MAFVQLRLPRIQQGRPIVDAQGYPATDFVRRLNDTFSAIETAYNGITDALNAAGIAQIAADNANMAAANAQAAADAANMAAGNTAAQQALIGSYIVPDSVLTSVGSAISVAAHTRFYADGTSVAVNAGSLTAIAMGDNYVSYLDAAHAGGTVAYSASSTPPTQIGATHVVGAITITGGAGTGGSGPSRPGSVQP